ncbi:HIT family protein [Natronosporangium hydrolyticum]|uniref:HIT family protein n=1 Tax=Natronosporangium hydrolyticum TaxID=2811111 RepID=A0A895Y7Z6_9ACTN|nr:HIT family protein [Natronosporangium hydrolyticum]QSB13471.1 HIT family protein [Natronosporangium hydrolyticum]
MGERQAKMIWRSANYVAFLSIYPNTPGATVVIPIEHYTSYVATAPAEVSAGLQLAAVEVAQLLDTAFPDVARTAIVYEGYGVDHLHAKLFPLHGTAELKDRWRPIHSNVKTTFDTYQGYVSSHDGPPASDDELSEIAEQIRATNQ